MFSLMNEAIARVTEEDWISHIAQLQREDFCQKKKKKKTLDKVTQCREIEVMIQTK
jgi:hypothetical protein